MPIHNDNDSITNTSDYSINMTNNVSKNAETSMLSTLSNTSKNQIKTLSTEQEQNLKALINLAASPNTNSDVFASTRLTSPSLLLSQSHAHNNNEARFSFLLANPSETQHFYCEDDLIAWQKSIQKSAPTIDHIKINKTDNHNGLNSIPLHSGWVGYYRYPSINSAITAKTDINTESVNKQQPIAEFYYYPWAICLNHQDNQFYLLGNPDLSAKAVFEKLTNETFCNPGKSSASKHNHQQSIPFSFSCTAFKPSWNKHDYTAAFQRIQEYLLAGDCYQVNLTHPHKAFYKGHALATLLPLYQSLNPNFGCYFQGQDCELVSVSPERFIKIDNHGKLEAKPIKGTIKRSIIAKDDARLITQLKNSSKDKAENLMIVDLLRNDLSMSAKPGSVTVDKLFAIESQPNVHHLVSTISSELKTGLHHSDAIYTAFPGGSITGAPKKRAMEIIEELECEARSLYCGSFGYYSDSGHTDFNILIRSLEFRENTVTCWGGGGITVDSNAEDEYEESLTKIRRIMDVIENTGKR